LCIRAATLAANKSIELCLIFKEFTEKITAMKAFVEERAAIESDYASRLSQWSSTWASRGQTVNPSADDDDEPPGMFHILASAGGTNYPNILIFVASFSIEMHRTHRNQCWNVRIISVGKHRRRSRLDSL